MTDKQFSKSRFQHIIMEEKIRKIFMIKTQLSDEFNEDQWEKISQSPPSTFLKTQQSILNCLLKNKSMFDKYFHRFYSNHVKILHWSLLAIEKKFQIEKFVFKRLVNNGITFYNEKIKQAVENRFVKTSYLKNKVDKRELKTLEDQVYKEFFKDIVNKNKEKKGLNLKLYGSKHKEEQDIDSHDFYIKTFNACNGWKYIFYNYEKHMKGLSEKHKYNESIRINRAKDLFEKRQAGRLNLTQFEHPTNREGQRKCNVVSINKFLNDRSLNSTKGFKSLAENKRIQKVVFVNHLGKPLTYKITRP